MICSGGWFLAAASAALAFQPPGAVSLEDALNAAPAHVSCAIRTADALARAPVAYRAFGLFGRSDLDQIPFAMSCSELVYYAYARCGVELGDEHRRTRFLAYQEPPPYPGGMAKVALEDLQVGDVLVYHRDREIVEREVALKGHARPGHAVILVDLERRLVIGSHGRESTPPSGTAGVGYRVLEHGIQTWDTDRILRAVFRPIVTASVTLPLLDTSTAADDAQ